MYEHEGKLLVRLDDGKLYDCFLTMTETGGCKVTLLEKTFDSRPHGATQVTADTIVRRQHLEIGESYPVVEKEQPVSANVQSAPMAEQEKIAAMAQPKAAVAQKRNGK